MTDTSPKTADRIRRLLLSRTPAQRLAMACGMFETAQSLVRAGLVRSEGGSLGRDRLRGLIFLRFYGEDFEIGRRDKILDQLCMRAAGEKRVFPNGSDTMMNREDDRV